MGLHHNPGIVTDGLVMCLDAQNTKSYSGSGNVWYDLTNSGINFTANVSPYTPTFAVNSWSFDASDEFTAPNNTRLDTQTPSVEVWIKTNNTTQNGHFFEKGGVNTEYSLFQEGTTIVWRQGGLSQYTTTATYISTTRFAQVVGTFSSGDRRTYINGVQVTADTITGIVGTSATGESIGVYGGNSATKGYWFNGYIAIVRIYNKALKAEEVARNFAANRGRFGI